jgi:hypothetical protein
MELNQIYPGMGGMILIDENSLQAQKLDEEATKNIMCIKELIEKH